MGCCGQTCAHGCHSGRESGFQPGTPCSSTAGRPSTYTAPPDPFPWMGCCAPMAAPQPCPPAGTHQVQLADLLLAFHISLVVCKDFKPASVEKGGVSDSRNACVGVRWWPVAAGHGAPAARSGASSNTNALEEFILPKPRSCVTGWTGASGGHILHQFTGKTSPAANARGCLVLWPRKPLRYPRSSYHLARAVHPNVSRP